MTVWLGFYSSSDRREENLRRIGSDKCDTPKRGGNYKTFAQRHNTKRSRRSQPPVEKVETHTKKKQDKKQENDSSLIYKIALELQKYKVEHIFSSLPRTK